VVVLAGCAALLAGASDSAGLQPSGTCDGVPATIVGTDAGELLNGTPGDDVVSAGGGDDFIMGFSGNDRLCGEAGNDIILGADGSDFLAGDADSDFLEGGLGDDRIDGGGGVGPHAIDFALFSLAQGPVQADLTTGRASGDGSDTLVGIDSLGGSRFGDTLVGDADINNLSGESGDDVLRGGGGFDLVLFGSRVEASLATGAATGEGSDRLVQVEGLSGARSTPNDDVFTGNGGPNYLSGGAGQDTLTAGEGDDRVYGGDGDDRVGGGNGNDTLGGDAGGDVLDAGPGVLDSVSYLSSPGAVAVNLATGRASGDGSDTVAGLEAVSGSQFGDELTGNRRPNALFGNAGNDDMAGGPGSDFLGGGPGRNSLSGNAGSDYCLLGRRKPGCESTALPGRLPGSPERPPLRTGPSGPTLAAVDAGLLRRLGATTLDRALVDSATYRLEAVREVLLAVRRCGQSRCRHVNDGWRRYLDRLGKSSPVGVLRPAAVRRTAEFEYWGAPACFSLREPYTTSISPPRRVQPVGDDGKAEEAWWRATLFRYHGAKRRWVEHRKTGWSRAQIAGGQAVSGVPTWQDPRRRTFTGEQTVRVGSGRYAWGAQLYWDRNGRSVYGWVEPHLHHARALRYERWCNFP
jgi:Ca2+-binding RTX toxin-like protein